MVIGMSSLCDGAYRPHHFPAGIDERLHLAEDESAEERFGAWRGGWSQGVVAHAPRF
jgi:hypothetical protein